MFRVTMVPPETSLEIEREFAAGLAECYGAYEVDRAVALLYPEHRSSVTHVIVRDGHHAIVGGARVHCAAPGMPLPALRALTGHPELRAALIGDAARSGPPMELASLWVSRASPEYRGLGRLVAQASVAAAATMQAPRAVTFSHHTIEPLLLGIGMRPTQHASAIPYPSSAYRSTIYDVAPLNPVHALVGDRAQMSAIRTHWTKRPSEIPIVANKSVDGLAWTIVPSKRVKVA